MNLDGYLQRALGRGEPSGGFDQRVLDMIRARRHRRSVVVRGGVAAALLTIVLSGGMWTRHLLQQQEIARGIKAREDLMLALQVTSRVVNLAREGVRRSDAAQSEHQPEPELEIDHQGKERS